MMPFYIVYDSYPNNFLHQSHNCSSKAYGAIVTNYRVFPVSGQNKRSIHLTDSVTCSSASPISLSRNRRMFNGKNNNLVVGFISQWKLDDREKPGITGWPFRRFDCPLDH